MEREELAEQAPHTVAARLLLSAEQRATQTIAEADAHAASLIEGASRRAAAIVAEAEALADERAAAHHEIVRLWAQLAREDVDAAAGGQDTLPGLSVDVRRLLHEVLWAESQREQRLLATLRTTQTRLHDELAASMDEVQQARHARELLAARVDELLATASEGRSPAPEVQPLLANDVALPWPRALTAGEAENTADQQNATDPEVVPASTGGDHSEHGAAEHVRAPGRPLSGSVPDASHPMAPSLELADARQATDRREGAALPFTIAAAPAEVNPTDILPRHGAQHWTRQAMSTLVPMAAVLALVVLGIAALMLLW